jgi:hypothetical protein
VSTQPSNESWTQALTHALVGLPDEAPIRDEDWPAWSAGFEAGLREGIARTRLHISVELVPIGPANAGLKLWRAVTQARLTERSRHHRSTATGQELREQAHRSWGLPFRGTQNERRRGR